MLALFLLLIAVSTAPHLEADTESYYVAPNGDDSNPGSLALPWTTIQKAASTVEAGSTVYVRDGVYNEQITIRVSGSASAGHTTFRNYEGESPVLDGTDLLADVSADNVGMILIVDQSYVTVSGFQIRNYRSTTPDTTPVGIHVRGRCHHIRLTNNRIHSIEASSNLYGGNAHGIAVYGTSSTSINNITIDNNELYDLKLGASEALVLNGNVEKFTVSNNSIHDVDNIALDFIGFEGTSGDPRLDQARDGVVSSNRIRNVSSYGNPAYGDSYSAGGIYVDGGRDITIENNRISEADIGIELASEHHGRVTSGIIVRNNVIFNNKIVGIAIGGYDTARGGTENCTIVNNTLYHNDTQQDGNGEILLQFDTLDNTIMNNILHANNQNLMIGNPFALNVSNEVDYNLYFGPAGLAKVEWQWRNVTYEGFDKYRSGTGNDIHSRFADPAFIDHAREDFHLKSTSPAIDAAYEGACPPNDISAIARPIDGDGNGVARCDMGAYEFELALPVVDKK